MAEYDLCPTGCPLVAAARQGNTSVLLAMLEEGCGHDVESECCYWLAIVSASSHQQTKCLRYLIDAGEKVAGPDKLRTLKRLAVMMAAHHGAADIIEVLLTSGSGINVNSRKHCSQQEAQRYLNRVNASLNDDYNAKLFCDVGATLKHCKFHDHEARFSCLTPLMVAARYGHTNTLLILLRAGAKLDTLDARMNSALRLAVEGGHSSCVAVLVESGRGIYRTDHFSKLLRNAVEKNQSACVEELLKGGAEANRPDWYQSTPLMEAVNRGHLNCVKILLAGGASVNLADRCNDTALTLAAKRGREDCVVELLRHGADVTIANRYHSTALMIAVEHGHDKTVRALLEAGADANFTNGNAQQPLVEAAIQGNASCVRALIDAGALVNITNKHGSTALHLAVERGYDECVRELLAAGARHDLVNTFSESALLLAVERGNETCVDLLLRAGAAHHVGNREGVPILILAVQSNRHGIMRALMQQDWLEKTLNAVNESLDHLPLIHHFIKNKHFDLMFLLCTKGADVNLADLHLGTPIIRLLTFPESDHEACVALKFLLRQGANPNKKGNYKSYIFGERYKGPRALPPLVIALILSRAQYARMLWLAGGNLGLNLQSTIAHVNQLKAHHSPTHWEHIERLIKKVYFQPRTLSQLCRLAIRRCLGQTVSTDLHSLPLPKRIIDFLNLAELDVIC